MSKGIVENNTEVVENVVEVKEEVVTENIEVKEEVVTENVEEVVVSVEEEVVEEVVEEVEKINLIDFGTGILKYKEEHMSDRYFKKKFNEFWGLGEDNNTGTKAEVMTFAKEKASKKSKLADWYNAILEELLIGVFTKKVADIERTTYVYTPKKKKATPKSKTAKGGENTKVVSGTKLIQSDADILADIIQKEKEEKAKK